MPAPAGPPSLAADPVVGPLLDRCTFPPPGTPVTCGLSGGADSTALVALAVAAGCRVEAVHLDHGLRPGSAAEAEVAARSCGTLGATFRSITVEVAAGPNLEARARAARRRSLPPGSLLGHTADDQAETVLLNLLWGAGLDGLAGMAVDNRPLLHLRRAETRALCQHLGLTVVEDPSNLDPRFRRNRIRHEVLPLLDEVAERDVAALLARQASTARADAELLDRLAADIDVADARALTAAPLPLARRAVRQWLRGEHPPDAATVARVLAVARGEARATDAGAGRRVVRSRNRLRLEGGPPAEGPSGDATGGH